ncbi:biotin/lipoyl-containing protein, partial [Rhizobiaceae sp. 2RAB30]
APSERAIAIAAFAASGAAVPTSFDPWSSLAGYAHFHQVARTVRLGVGDHTVSAAVTAQPSGRFDVAVEGFKHALSLSPEDTRAVAWPGHVTVFDDHRAYTFAVADLLSRSEEAAGGGDSLRAPMPGLVKVVRAEAGQTVTKGQPLLVLEAMKMEHTIAAPHDGVIAAIATEGAQVT